MKLQYILLWFLLFLSLGYLQTTYTLSQTRIYNKLTDIRDTVRMCEEFPPPISQERQDKIDDMLGGNFNEPSTNKDFMYQTINYIISKEPNTDSLDKTTYITDLKAVVKILNTAFSAKDEYLIIRTQADIFYRTVTYLQQLGNDANTIDRLLQNAGGAPNHMSWLDYLDLAEENNHPPLRVLTYLANSSWDSLVWDLGNKELAGRAVKNLKLEKSLKLIIKLSRR